MQCAIRSERNLWIWCIKNFRLFWYWIQATQKAQRWWMQLTTCMLFAAFTPSFGRVSLFAFLVHIILPVCWYTIPTACAGSFSVIPAWCKKNRFRKVKGKVNHTTVVVQVLYSNSLELLSKGFQGIWLKNGLLTLYLNTYILMAWPARRNVLTHKPPMLLHTHLELYHKRTPKLIP